MSAKNMKLLRQGAKKFSLPYNVLKNSFKKLNSEGRRSFLKQAKINIDLL